MSSISTNLVRVSANAQPEALSSAETESACAAPQTAMPTDSEPPSNTLAALTRGGQRGWLFGGDSGVGDLSDDTKTKSAELK